MIEFKRAQKQTGKQTRTSLKGLPAVSSPFYCLEWVGVDMNEYSVQLCFSSMILDCFSQGSSTQPEKSQ